MPFPHSFSTARLRAERLRAEHLPDLLRMHRDPVQMAMLGGVQSAEQTADYLARNLRHWADHGFGVWILRCARSDRVAGRAILRHLLLEGRDEVEVGYSLWPELWGRGLATEIARECLRLGRQVLGLPSIVAITLPENARSRRVMIKIGMVYERDVLHAGLQHVLYRTRG